MAWIRGFEEAFNPRAVAIVGVSRSDRQRHPGGTGLSFLRRLRQLGFEGRIYPVNPNASEIEGTKVYPSVTAIPEPLDLVMVTVPAAFVPQVLEDCVAAKALNVHICTSGFGETGEEEGKRLESRMRDIALMGGLRVIGPNCMGLQVPSVRMGTMDDLPLVQGPVAFISQSGGHAHTYLEHGPTLGVGFSKVISYGNALVLDAPDFLEYFATDPETRIVCMYIEGIRDGARLTRLVRELNPTKPVVVLKGGLTNSGARAASSHTGSLAGDRQTWDAFFKQTGAIRVGSIEEMAEVTMALLRLGALAGKRVAVLGGGGGNSVATGDVCAEEGLDVPLLSPETHTKLMESFSLVNQSVTNPLDAPSLFRDVSLLHRAIELLAADSLVDVVIVSLNIVLSRMVSAKTMGEIEKCISDLSMDNPRGKPIVVALQARGRIEEAERYAQKLREDGITAYSSLQSTCRALSRLADYYEFIGEVSDSRVLGSRVSRAAQRRAEVAIR